ncbi:MAG: DUF493 domain-containing protein [Desulfuromonas sp.]|nr:MAG: DUF493 domain-containing protein [Desulfuromonas sp.]
MATPVRELLNFPCDHIFKAFGPAEQGDLFVAAVRQAVETVVPLSLDALKVRASNGGRYQCVSVIVMLQSAEQLEAIYLALRQVAGITYLL